MVKFCPTCGNMLLVEQHASVGLRFFCQACPYIHRIYIESSEDVPRQRKKAEFIIGSADDWKNVAEAEATCPSCGHDKAYYRSLQIRSADEPSTSFYRCSKPTCGHQWKED